MDLAYVKKVLKMVEESSVNEIELEEKGVRIRIAKSSNNVSAFHQVAPSFFVPPPAQPAPAQQPLAPAVEAPPAPVAEKKYHEIKSPIVGTFYRAPAPDAANYVDVGQDVESGSVVCIVEAMKLMNEIESDIAGKIVKVCVENAKPVEYNQVLFLVEAA
ncbi:MAG TPA: acetyl-CoA carboxylase biotin carboxyl carrier protein [Bacteroidota bacterium]|nr:acetyl-CoA carboxylase biotin carboxyl carrier protein [Bacteroidota bacterium]